MCLEKGLERLEQEDQIHSQKVGGMFGTRNQ